MTICFLVSDMYGDGFDDQGNVTRFIDTVTRVKLAFVLHSYFS